jgi:predicted hydrocarbon binding protein
MMHPLAKKLLISRKLTFGENGVMEILDNEAFAFDSSLLLYLHKEMSKESLYKAGFDAGSNVVKELKKTGLSGTKMVGFVLDLLSMCGFGDLKVEDFDITTKTGEVRSKNTVVVRAAKKHNIKDVKCHLISGLLAGIFSESYDEKIGCEEYACMLDKSDVCRFKLKAFS